MLLQTTWFLLWGILWIGYFILDGFDLGLGTIMPFVSKNDIDRRIIYNSMGPVWDGNEVWLITAGGVTFAAFPKVYAVMFSTLYTPLLILLFALIVRGVSFEFRNKVDSAAWRSVWDLCMVVGSFIPALLLGVTFANIFRGLPIDDNGILHGNLFTLLNPYGLLGGILFVCLFVVHGAIWLAVKSEGELHERGASFANKAWFVLLVVAVVFLIVTAFATPLYNNYLKTPVLFIIPIITVLALLGTKILLLKKSYWKAWTASAVTIATAALFGVVGLFPNMFLSTINQQFSLTAFNASGSPLTLKVMLIVAIIFVPIVIVYQFFTYKLFSGKLTEKDLEHDEAY